MLYRIDIRMNVQRKKWLLCRVDDNGNRFLIDRFETRDQSEKTRLKFEEKGHKQTFLINKEQ